MHGYAEYAGVVQRQRARPEDLGEFGEGVALVGVDVGAGGGCGGGGKERGTAADETGVGGGGGDVDDAGR